jgi:hypothetical protein
MVHVPYRGNAPALTDLLAGQVQVMFADTLSSIEHLKKPAFPGINQVVRSVSRPAEGHKRKLRYRSAP